jgi:catechol 2,3-dioxygenase-like lactoylglutathione lyase family enzyme
MIKGIAHVCFVVRDLETSLAFYRDALGLHPAFEFRNAAGARTGAYLHAGERTFMELFAGQPAPAAATGSFRHVCLEVDDVSETVKRLREKGVAVDEPKMGADQSWQAWLSDPDGNRIELHGYTERSAQIRYLAAAPRPAPPVVI